MPRSHLNNINTTHKPPTNPPPTIISNSLCAALMLVTAYLIRNAENGFFKLYVGVCHRQCMWLPTMLLLLLSLCIYIYIRIYSLNDIQYQFCRAAKCINVHTATLSFKQKVHPKMP